MHRIHSLKLKLFSKTFKNLSNTTATTTATTTASTASIPSTRSLFDANIKNPSHHQRHGFFSHYTSWSSRPPPPPPPNTVFPAKVSNGFFCSNPILGKLLLRNTLLSHQSKGHFGDTVKGLRAQFSRRSFHSNFSFGSNRGARFPQLTSDGVVLGLILTNVAVFMLWRIADRSFMMKNFTISLDNFLNGRVHTVITSAFSHIDIGHLISNMIGLYFFGTSLGRVFGPEFVLKLYLAGAVGGSVFYLVHHAFMAQTYKRKQKWSLDSSKVPALGASGAVNAIMLLDIFLFPKKTLYFDFIIPVPAILLGIFLIGKDVLRILEGDSRISGSAHLGGATVAALTWGLIRRGRFRF